MLVKPALLGRMVVVPYYPLGDEELGAIVKLKLTAIADRFQESHRAPVVR
jgi:type VI secretion system protein VasG